MTQKEALEILKSGVNVFITGSAGSGKTYLLNQYINYLRDKNIPTAITASTGIAATHLGGMTIHSWAGIGIKENITKYELEMLESKEYLVRRIQNTNVLIIDEVSMLDAKRLDMVEWVCRHFKRNDRAFGGMQVILCGDFFQLPPVKKSFLSETEKNPRVEAGPGLFGGEEELGAQTEKDMVIYSRAWRTMRPAMCYLSEQYRQEDSLFLEILNGIRAGKVSEEHFKLIEARMNIKFPLGVEPTRLYTHNLDVDAINQKHLDKIGGAERIYQMEGNGSEMLIKVLKKSCLAPEILRLKVGAEVMFLKNNFEKGYVNGTRGKVYTFLADNTPIIKLQSGAEITAIPEEWVIEENGKRKAVISQLPLRLAWAITIHKSQGMSLDSAEIDLSKTFTYGMGYVALSRARTLAGVRLVGFHRDALLADPRVLELDKDFQKESAENQKLFGNLSKDEFGKMQSDFILRMANGVKSKSSRKSRKERVRN